jgi:hypothetical protein
MVTSCNWFYVMENATQLENECAEEAPNFFGTTKSILES